FIHGHDGPHIGRTKREAMFTSRSLVISRNEILRPLQLPGTRVERAHDTAWRISALVVRDGGSNHDKISRDCGRRSNLIFALPSQPPDVRLKAQIDFAVLTEAIALLSVLCVDGDQPSIVRARENPSHAFLVRPHRLVRPRRDSAARELIFVLHLAIDFRIKWGSPDLAAEKRIERNDSIKWRAEHQPSTN